MLRGRAGLVAVGGGEPAEGVAHLPDSLSELPGRRVVGALISATADEKNPPESRGDEEEDSEDEEAGRKMRRDSQSGSMWVIFLVVASVSVVPAAAAGDKQHGEASGQQAVDDILKDTMLLLEALDQRLAAVQNKTPNALMRDNLRALELGGAPAVDHEPPSAAGQAANSTSGQAGKQARQLQMEANQFASDSTERHISFTLDLMQAVFASQTSAAPAAKKNPPTSNNKIDSFLISPLSIQMVLMMLHLGARGQTRRELASSLHLAGAEQKPESALPGSASESAGKLKRRNQLGERQPAGRQSQQQRGASASTSASSTPTPTPTPASQPQVSASSGASSAHEMFGAAVRNLLKDQSVLRALTSANQLFLQKNLPLAASFEWAIKQHYAADVRQVDFQHQATGGSGSNSSSVPENKSPAPNGSAAGEDKHEEQQASPGNNVQQIVNDWVERQSRGKIQNFLAAPVPVSTLLLAINVIYFKGDWQYKFDPADTEPEAVFTQADGRQVKTAMMVNRLPLAYAHDAAMRTAVVELPYKAQRLGLFLMLPDEVSGIFHTMQMLNATSFAHLISSMRRPPTSAASGAPEQGGINIRIPRFSIESSPRLSQILSQQLGLRSLFAADVADLTGMFAPAHFGKRLAANKTTDSEQPQPPAPQVGLDELIHKAVLQVDEQGSVAAASSATLVERVGTFSGNYFEADHPFLIFLMDKQTGLVLFSGVFAGASQQQQQQPHSNGSLAASCKRNFNSQQCT